MNTQIWNPRTSKIQFETNKFETLEQTLERNETIVQRTKMQQDETKQRPSWKWTAKIKLESKKKR